mmetsp:Transcript_22516/g.22241  ORF Transcript_22516/g.22241 Transcript_22516/m.22241 type:complete len:156 (+) Transcript_22516:707-1174(+)
MYILLVGKPPYRIDSEREVLDQIKNRQLDFNDEEYQRTSPLAKDLLSKLLDTNYNKRITAREALKHPWFVTVNQKSTDCNNEIILKRLRTYQVKGRLKKEIMKIIVRLLEPEDIQNLKEVFELLDTDHNGYITYEDFEKGLSTIGVTDASEIEQI